MSKEKLNKKLETDAGKTEILKSVNKKMQQLDDNTKINK